MASPYSQISFRQTLASNLGKIFEQYSSRISMGWILSRGKLRFQRMGITQRLSGQVNGNSDRGTIDFTFVTFVLRVLGAYQRNFRRVVNRYNSHLQLRSSTGQNRFRCQRFSLAAHLLVLSHSVRCVHHFNTSNYRVELSLLRM